MVQSISKLPGGKKQYHDTLVEFLIWLKPREHTTNADARAWFVERFRAAKMAQCYPPVLRDFGVVELERGRDIPDQYHLFPVFNMGREPEIYILHGSLKTLCQLEPVLFRTVI